MNNFLVKKVTRILLVVICLVFLPQISNAQSQPASGWIFSKVDYVGAAVCPSPSQASIEFVLAEKGTTNPLSKPIGKWSVKTRDASLVRLLSEYYDGQKTSGKICFDPTVEGIQVLVDDSGDYYEYSGPTVFPAPGSDFSSMRGFHFRGYVELLPKSFADPDVTSISPNNGNPFNSSPVFTVSTNRLSSLFNTTELRAVKLYALKQSNKVLYTDLVAANGGAGVRNINGFASAALPNGVYLWTFHQEFNGNKTTTSPGGARVWNFTGQPLSSVPEAQSFMIDVAPLSVNSKRSIAVSSLPDASAVEASVVYQHKLRDTLSGLDSATIYVTDNLDNIILVNPIQIRVPGNVYGPLSETVISLNIQAQIGETYKFYVVASDVAGNISTSDVTSYTVPSVYSEPVLGNLTVDTITNESAQISAIISSNGGLVLLERGSCWSLSEAELLAGGGSCKSLLPLGIPPYRFYDTHTGLPASSTIYFRGFARNEVGTGYTAIETFSTLIDPFSISTTTVNAPTISTRSETFIRANSATLRSRITSTGGALITQRGICWDTSLPALTALDVTLPSANCIQWGVLPAGATLPHDAENNFGSMPGNTQIYYRVFAINAAGIGEAYDSFTTLSEYYDFQLEGISVSSSYFDTTDTYELDVDFSEIDMSSYAGAADREIDYQVKIDLNNDGTFEQTKTGKISSPWRIGGPLKTVTFNNLPGGLVRTEVTINEPESAYTEDVTRRANNTKETVYLLSRSGGSLIDATAGDGGGVGSIDVSDPGMSIWSASPVVLKGKQTTIFWDTKSGLDMDCTVYGPGSFVRQTFNPYIDGPTGDAPSGTLNSAQNYLLECIEPVTGTTFTSELRVKVVGVIEEI